MKALHKNSKTIKEKNNPLKKIFSMLIYLILLFFLTINSF